MGVYYIPDELKHHGIRGMRWGIRRYQNKDGSLTAAGKKRVQKLDKERRELTGRITPFARKPSSLDPPEPQKKKSVSEMSDAELRDAYNRTTNEINYLRNLNTLKEFNPEPVSKGKKFISGVGDVVVPAVKDAAKDSLTKFLKKTLSNALGVSEKDIENTSDALAREAKDWGNREKIAKSKKYFENEKAKKEAEAKKAQEKAQKEKEAAEAKKRADQAKVDDINDAAENSYRNNRRSRNDTSSTDDTVYEGEVSGEGTSRRQRAERERTRRANETIWDVPFEDISDEDVSSGRTYTSKYSSSNTSLAVITAPRNAGLLSAGQNYIAGYLE